MLSEYPVFLSYEEYFLKFTKFGCGKYTFPNVSLIITLAQCFVEREWSADAKSRYYSIFNR